MKILILTALPQEYSPLKRLLPSWRLVQRRPFKKFAFSLPGKGIELIETGMGGKSAKAALEFQLAGFTPDLLIFSGFAGGLHPDLPVGSVCVAVSTRELSSEAAFRFRFPDGIAHFLDHNHIRPVRAFSAESPENKQVLSALAVGQPAVLDMETATVAEIALHNKIPFICFRALSDALGHDLGFNLSDISDERGRVKLTSVFFTIIKHPATLKAFYFSWRRSTLAARNLCRSVAAFLDIPAPALGKMAGNIRIERESTSMAQD
jgi:adenosylhomocysteine nucleosidase